jgi:hypothetical protein
MKTKQKSKEYEGRCCNLALKYGIFEGDFLGLDINNVPIYDRVVDEEFLEQYIGGLFTNGIGLFIENCFQVFAELDNQITVKSGLAIINGKMAYDKFDASCDLPDSPITYNRYDRVVVRRDNVAREIKVMCISGAESVAPTAPEPVRSENIHDLVLATVLRSPLDNVTQSQITDNRMDAVLCGVISPKTNVLDNTDLFVQFTAVFNEMKAIIDQDFIDWAAEFQTWFDMIKGILGTDEAGALLLLIQQNAANIATDKDKITTGTITSNWTGTAVPYTQTISNSDVTATNTVEISLAPAATEAQTVAWDDLNLKDGGQTAGSFTLKCWGTPNLINIPVVIAVRGA